MKQLILASSSSRRIELLKKAGFRFRVIPSGINERSWEKRATDPVELVKTLAIKKVKKAASKLEEGIVVGADTVVEIDGEIFGKPISIIEARNMLKKLNGNFHNVYTGLALLDVKSKKSLVDYEKTKVKFRKLNLRKIKSVSKNNLDKAGSYAIQDENTSLVEKIQGNYDNVVGLPVKKLRKMLSKLEKWVEERKNG